MRNYLVTAAIAAFAAVLLAAPALGARGKPRGSNATATPATVTASVSSTTPGSTVWLQGCGYALAPVEVDIVHSAGYTEVYSAAVWTPGCFGGTFTTAERGSYTIQVFQDSGGGRTLMASTVLTVA